MRTRDPIVTEQNVADAARRFFVEQGRPRVADEGTTPRPLVGSSFRVHGAVSDEFEVARSFQTALFDAGLAWLTGPREFGGAGLAPSAVEQFESVAREFDSPDRQSLAVGLLIVAPALAAFGTDEQKRDHLRSLFRGDEVACQLFSEPEAGSDLASLRTRAVRDGDTWRVTGQKIWSSGAHRSHIGELLARTDADPSLRHRGLSMFILDMDSPGIEIRRIRQMNGGSHFCEVYLDDVVVPDTARLGAVGDGWRVANVSLNSERGGLSAESLERFNDLHGHLVGLAAELGLRDEWHVRARLVDSHIRTRLNETLAAHLATSKRASAVAPSLIKLATTDSDWAIAQHAAALLGMAIAAEDGGGVASEWRDVLLAVPAPRIAGGADQIQRNIIAERGLGLPRDARS